ncbi:hypothetical protein CHS0354_013959 [Potamilus streckersoni]|uniref:FAM234A/B beta-propeller domain-containing protein n=1 Tax=Potamilus streckersoni TaxID=2493646 RepID=A0AAE0RWS8_9BIVA|nr:hypothetical protein CHS0354_013959 [Potamilus streckersoni]
METKVFFSRRGKKNGYIQDEFEKSDDWENEYSDEDEVFVKDQGIENGSAEPLMYSKQRSRIRGRGSDCSCKSICKAVLCFFFLVTSLGSLMGLVVYYVNKPSYTKPGSQISTQSLKEENLDIIGCDSIQVEDVWVKGFPKLLTETAFRLVDVNKDGVLDVILGFATGADGYKIPKIVCDIYFNGTYPCFGGLMALEGFTGIELWRHYGPHELFGINCNADLDKDGIPDCLCGGRSGAFQAISGKTGSLIWNFDSQDAKNEIMNLYTAHILPDLDGDGTVDVLAIHGGDPLSEPGSKFRLSGRIILFSGRTGTVLRWVGVPDAHESYYSPQIYTLPDGDSIVLFGTGGETHSGALWRIRLRDLAKGEIKKARQIYYDSKKGIMTPPVLLDLTGDGVEDIVMSMFNSSILAIDGDTYQIIWNYTFPMSESYNTPAPGFYNDDDTPDFMVKYAYGPGFPIYYHSQTTVLDGKTGQPLITPPLRDTVGAQASSLTISMEGHGNDVFLYWIADCLGHEGEGGEYAFVKGTNVHEQSRADNCRLRFKTKGFSKVYAISQHIPGPGVTIYYSVDRDKVETKYWINTTAEGLDYIRRHPEYKKYLSSQNDTSPNDTPASHKQDATREMGREYLLDTPNVPYGQRTSYKKGQQVPYDTDEHQRRIFSEYNNGRPFYKDSDNLDNDGSIYRNSRRNRLRGYPYPFEEDYYIETTPNYFLPRRKYGDRYPIRSYSVPRNKRFSRMNANFQAQRKERRKKRNGETNEFSNLSEINMLDKYIFSHTRKQRADRTRSNQRSQNRKRRHVGPHDEDGLQRLLSTGTLAPTTLPIYHPDFNHSIDFVFATYWFFPAKTQAVLPEDQKCIAEKLSQEIIRFDTNSKYYGMDNDAYEHAVTEECISKHNSDAGNENRTYESQTQYNPFNIHMGQMTVYRLRLTCKCSRKLDPKKQICGRVLPFDKQQWTGYMGNKADSHWVTRK